MKSFEYTITDPAGVHARPAGLLVKEVKNFAGAAITITKGDKSVNVLRLMALMGMNIKQGDTVTVSIEGENEESVAAALEDFFKTNL